MQNHRLKGKKYLPIEVNEKLWDEFSKDQEIKYHHFGRNRHQGIAVDSEIKMSMNNHVLKNNYYLWCEKKLISYNKEVNTKTSTLQNTKGKAIIPVGPSPKFKPSNSIAPVAHDPSINDETKTKDAEEECTDSS